MSTAHENPGYVDADYLKMAADVTESVKRRSYELMAIEAGQRVLDVGCGPATDTIALAALVGKHGEVVGVDYDAEMIQTANQRAAEAGVAAWVSHRQADVTSLPLETASFDACRSERVFQHLPDSVAALDEMKRVTRLDGRIVVADTDLGSVCIDTPEIDIERRLVRFKTEIQRNGYSGRRLYGLFKRSGLRNIEIESYAFHSTDYKFFWELAGLPEAGVLAIQANAISKDELHRLRASLEDADEVGAFFGLFTQVLVAGTK